MTEAEFQKAVIDLAQRYGWIVAHFRTALMQSGRWATPVQADGKGFPDLVMLRPPEMLVVELKGQRGQIRPEQRAWLDAFVACDVEVYEWKPKDWPLIEARLKPRPRPRRPETGCLAG